MELHRTMDKTQEQPVIAQVEELKRSMQARDPLMNELVGARKSSR